MNDEDKKRLKKALRSEAATSIVLGEYQYGVLIYQGYEKEKYHDDEFGLLPKFITKAIKRND